MCRDQMMFAINNGKTGRQADEEGVSRVSWRATQHAADTAGFVARPGQRRPASLPALEAARAVMAVLCGCDGCHPVAGAKHVPRTGRLRCCLAG